MQTGLSLRSRTVMHLKREAMRDPRCIAAGFLGIIRLGAVRLRMQARARPMEYNAFHGSLPCAIKAMSTDWRKFFVRKRLERA